MAEAADRYYRLAQRRRAQIITVTILRTITVSVHLIDLVPELNALTVMPVAVMPIQDFGKRAVGHGAKGESGTETRLGRLQRKNARSVLHPRRRDLPRAPVMGLFKSDDKRSSLLQGSRIAKNRQIESNAGDHARTLCNYHQPGFVRIKIAVQQASDD